MALGQARMVESGIRILDQSDPVHHRARRVVARRHERNQRIEAAGAESEVERRAGSLGRITPPPLRARQPPTDFNPPEGPHVGCRFPHADEARERGHAGNFNGPRAISGALELSGQKIRARVALRARQ